MLAHFARDMGKDITLAGEIDTKHRARQHLSHRSLGYDLSFLRHRLNYTLERVSLNRRREFPTLIETDLVKRWANIHRVPGVSTMHRIGAVPP